MAESSLDMKMRKALLARQERQILRKLPNPPSSELVDFTSNDYLSLSTHPSLRAHFLSRLSAAPNALGSGGSRLLVNGQAHADFENRLAKFFNAPSALLFNSGFDANVGFFACVPQPGDVVVHDEYIHASVHDGIRAARGRYAAISFAHNHIPSLRQKLNNLLQRRPEFATADASVFVAVESLYSMDGTLAPLSDIVDLVEELFPRGNGYVVVDEAHATGIYGAQGRGLVAHLGLESRVFARLHTFGKALAATGAVMLTNKLTRDYMLNYARSLIYTTSLSYANVIAADCSFDYLQNGVASTLAHHLLSLSAHLLSLLRPKLLDIPPTLLSLPPHLSFPSPSALLESSPSSLAFTELTTPIVPIMTAHAYALSAHLRSQGLHARPITWPTVPHGKDRVRICLHAGNSFEDVEQLVDAMVKWAHGIIKDGYNDEEATVTVSDEAANSTAKESRQGNNKKTVGVLLKSKL